MKSEAALRRSMSKITGYIEKYVILAGAEKKEEVLQLFDSMQLLFPHWVIMTCPVMHPDICYVSPNASHIMGRSADDMSINSRPDLYFRFVHEADRDYLLRCFSYMHDYLETVSPEKHNEYRSVYHYRFEKTNEQYIYLHDEKAALHLKGSGNLYYSLFRDITMDRAFNGVKVELFKQEQTLKKIEELKPDAEYRRLSKRENDLLHLIRQGLSTKEIGSRLKLSHNTVRNIKSRMFEKFEVNNTIELLNKSS